MGAMVEVKTSELAGELLGWAVGQAEGVAVKLEPPGYNTVPWRVFARYTGEVTVRDVRYDPQDSWTLGGPLIRRNKVSLHAPQHDADCWAAWLNRDGKDVAHGGDTELVAACRAIVLAKLGAVVQVPAELLP